MSWNRNTYTFNFIDILSFLIRRWKTIASISLAGAVISAVVSLLIRPEFIAQAVIFPSSNGSFSGAYLSEITSKDKNQDPLALGEEEDAEQLLQILQSDYVSSSVIRRFKLMEHYEINPQSKGADLKLAKRYQGNVKVRRNQYSAIEITVTDHDPVFAADIANAVVAYADTAKVQMLRSYSQRVLVDIERYLAEKENYLDELKDSMNELGKKGIVAPDEQVKGLMEQAAIAASRGDQRTMQYVDEKIKSIGTYVGDYFRVNRAMVEEAQKLADLRKKYEQAKVNASSDIPSNFSVNKAFAPGDRSYPVRWLIVASSTLAAFVLACLLLLFFEHLYLPLKKQMAEGQ